MLNLQRLAGRRVNPVPVRGRRFAPKYAGRCCESFAFVSIGEPRASVGIFVFAKGHEPDEVGDFRRIGEDYFCTVDRNDLAACRALTYFDAAYKIARTMVVAAARKDSVEEVDLKFIEEQVDSLIAWSDRIEDKSTEARIRKVVA